VTLTELKYVVALAQERHFGRAAQKCFVTQPTLSLALAKLEDELGVKLFERNRSEVLVTSRGNAVVEQARRVLDEAGRLQDIARGGQDQLAGTLRLGVIPTIGPYLLPDLVPILRRRAPQMPLSIEENLTGNLAPMLREGGARRRGIVALPFSVPGVKTLAIYEEPFSVVVPEGHRWQARKAVRTFGPRRREPPGAQQRALLPRPGPGSLPRPIQYGAGRGARGQLARHHPQYGRLGTGRERVAGERAHATLRLANAQVGGVLGARALAQGGARVAHELRPPGRGRDARRGDPLGEDALPQDGEGGVIIRGR
jgi:DNA-binding transcriptional LysR family regulator